MASEHVPLLLEISCAPALGREFRGQAVQFYLQSPTAVPRALACKSLDKELGRELLGVIQRFRTGSTTIGNREGALHAVEGPLPVRHDDPEHPPLHL